MASDTANEFASALRTAQVAAFPDAKSPAAMDTFWAVLYDVLVAFVVGGGGTLADGVYGDVTVSGGGTVITVDSVSSTSKVAGLDAALAGKSDVGHTHVAANVTDLGALATKSTVAAGDIDANAVTTAKIQNNAVTVAKIQQVLGPALLGRVAASLGDIDGLTPTQATALLDTFTSLLKGLVPASGGGTSNFLRADGSWAAPPSAGGVLIGVQVKTSGTAQTYTRTNSSVTKMFVEVVGGGGGGGGASYAASAEAYGAGGGGGGYAGKLFTWSGSATYLYTVGPGGSGGAAGGAGSAGTNTSFTDSLGTTITGNGGGLGAGMATGTTALQAGGGAGGSGTGGDINLAGSYGENGVRTSGTFGWSGGGGASGKGYGSHVRNLSSGVVNGLAYGGGGTGGAAASVATVGGNGADGVVVIWEYA